MYVIMTNDPVKCTFSDTFGDLMKLFVNRFLINSFGAKCKKLSNYTHPDLG